MINTMQKSEIENLILNSPTYQQFILGSQGYLDVIVHGVPVKIFKEEVGAMYYYRFPYNKSYHYEKVVEFMKYAIPVLSEAIEEERSKKILGPDCIKPDTLS